MLQKIINCPDKQSALETVSKNGLALKHLPDIFSDDKDVVIAAICNDRDSFHHVPDHLKSDKSFLLELVSKSGLVLKHFPKEFQDSKEIVLAAVAENPGILGYASGRLSNDKEIVMTAISKNGRALRLASKQLRADKELVMVASQNNGYALQFTTKEMQNDKKILTCALQSQECELAGLIAKDIADENSPFYVSKHRDVNHFIDQNLSDDLKLDILFATLDVVSE